MGAYLEGETTLKEDLKHKGQENHERILKMWDQGGVVVVKLQCVECRRHIGWSKGDPSRLLCTIISPIQEEPHVQYFPCKVMVFSQEGGFQ